MSSEKQIGRYEIRSKIGAGGMGEVYLAHDLLLDREIALKVLSPEFAQDEEWRARFLQEARAASGLNHPNIITIYEIGEHDGSWFIAMEFIEGETLREFLKNTRPTVQNILKIAEQTASALSVAHEKGIIHRDIKPENIMIRAADGLVKVLDFGLAKLTEKTTDGQNPEAVTRLRLQTSARFVLGTFAYMSPEQARSQQLDGRTDIWSLGVCLYEMLTGKSPFAGETTSDIIAAILKTEPETLDDFSEDVPGDLQGITVKALAKEREKRYQTMQEFREILTKLRKKAELAEEVQINYPTGKNRSVQLTGDENETKILPVQTAKSTSLIKIKRFKTAFITIGFLLITASVFGLWILRSSKNQITKAETVAVIPFTNVGGNIETEYLSDGITESLINNLSRLPRLTVKARSSVFRYKGQEFEPRKLGGELSVETIITGRVIEKESNLTLNVELIETQTGNLLWGETYRGRTSDLIELQSQIFRDVSAKIQKQTTSDKAQQDAGRKAKDYETYRNYLIGRYFLNTRKSENFEKAVVHFRQAIEREPDYAPAYAGLSDTYTELSYWSFGLPKENMPKARAAAQKAIEFDETLSEAHVSLATVAEDYDWNFALAEKEYLRAIELNPNNSVAYDRYGGFLCEQTRFAEGLEKLEKAAQLDPLSPGVEMSKGACLYQARRYDEAVLQMQKIIKATPDYLPAQSLLGAIYLRQGNYEKTAEVWLKNSPLENYTPAQVDDWKRSFATGGIKAFLQKDIEFRKEALRQGRNQTLFIAMQYANLDDKEQALEWLERAFEERHSWLGEIAVEPAWDKLRDNPRFQNLAASIGFGKR